MLVLYESPAGYALFKLLDDGKLSKPDDLYKSFEDENKANSILKLKAFSKFQNMTEALSAATALMEGKLTTDLESFLKKQTKDTQEKLAVLDSKLGSEISKTLGLKIVSDNAVMELFRGIRSQFNNIVTGIQETDLNTMALGLSHSLSRYKLKFSPDKIDTMIVQAISLLDDLDKELNTYCMRIREWYGWHFPELSRIIQDNIAYAKVVRACGMRQNIPTTDLTEILPEELAKEVVAAVMISMGTEISEEDIASINALADEIISINSYRQELHEYLKNRMNAIAPNVSALLGEQVGARLIAHAGSLMALAKAPASTVQIFGAEKALFRAMKTKQNTPKYGLIYHASLVGQAAPKIKGKISRVLAAKTSLAARVDALGEEVTNEIGLSGRTVVENRLKHLEDALKNTNSGSAKFKPQNKKVSYGTTSNPSSSSAQSQGNKRYNPEQDFSAASSKKAKKEK